MRFSERLTMTIRQQRSLLCVGLDPEPERLPDAVLRAPDPVLAFNRAIIAATADLVCAYKPNLAFYEALGPRGLLTLEATLRAIPAHTLVIADAKRGDIGNSARLYARAAFEAFGFDAVTVNPYLGADSVAPFLEYADRGVFLLCRTSNPGARDLQDRPGRDGRPLYEAVALAAQEWNVHGNCGLVVGATYPRELQAIRALCPDMPFLIPGVGAQGGDLEASVRAGVTAAGDGALIAASRAVLYASAGADFADVARQVAMELRDAIEALSSLNNMHKDVL
jgi:orotidine-5'-phosphate decarboxylase